MNCYHTSINMLLQVALKTATRDKDYDDHDLFVSRYLHFILSIIFVHHACALCCFATANANIQDRKEKKTIGNSIITMNSKNAGECSFVLCTTWFIRNLISNVNATATNTVERRRDDEVIIVHYYYYLSFERWFRCFLLPFFSDSPSLAAATGRAQPKMQHKEEDPSCMAQTIYM